MPVDSVISSDKDRRILLPHKLNAYHIHMLPVPAYKILKFPNNIVLPSPVLTDLSHHFSFLISF